MTTEYSLCRTCGTRAPKENMESIFNSQDIGKKFKGLLSVNLVLDRRLPEFMCRPCVMELNLTHEFIQKALAIQKQQLDAILNSDVSIDTIPSKAATSSDLPEISERSEPVIQQTSTVYVFPAPTLAPKLVLPTKDLSKGQTNKAGYSSPELVLLDEEDSPKLPAAAPDPPPKPASPPPAPKPQLKLKPISSLMKPDATTSVQTQPHEAQTDLPVAQTSTVKNLSICLICSSYFDSKEINSHHLECAKKSKSNTQVVKPMQHQPATSANAVVQYPAPTQTQNHLMLLSAPTRNPITIPKIPTVPRILKPATVRNSNFSIVSRTLTPVKLSMPLLTASSPRYLLPRGFEPLTPSSTRVNVSILPTPPKPSNDNTVAKSMPISTSSLTSLIQLPGGDGLPRVMSCFSLAPAAPPTELPHSPYRYAQTAVNKDLGTDPLQGLSSLMTETFTSPPPLQPLKEKTPPRPVMKTPARPTLSPSPEEAPLDHENYSYEVSKLPNVTALVSFWSNPDYDYCSLFASDENCNSLFTECLGGICHCSECRIFFLSKVEYMLHLEKNGKNEQRHKYFPCFGCKVNFSTARLLKEHHCMGLHGNVKDQFSCSLCPVFNSQEHHLLKHMLRMHCFCPHCHTNLQKLRTELLSKKQICSLEPRKCQTCGLVMNKYAESALLACKKIDRVDKAYICNICSLAFKSKEILTAHFKVRHSHEDGMKDLLPFENPHITPHFGPYVALDWEIGKKIAAEKSEDQTVPRPALVGVDPRSSRSSLESSRESSEETIIKLENTDETDEETVPKKRKIVQYCCLDCPDSFPQFGELLEHVKISHQKSSFKCDKCGRNFNSEDESVSHNCNILRATNVRLQLVKIEDMLD